MWLLLQQCGGGQVGRGGAGGPGWGTAPSVPSPTTPPRGQNMPWKLWGSDVHLLHLVHTQTNSEVRRHTKNTSFATLTKT